ncbi:MAG: transcription elongation factor GreAB [Kiritimatiellae bacterium]|jgi:hypothetical protein|nr:transcription elongation factor GreAB [Kiritimatiellia bacterium]
MNKGKIIKALRAKLEEELVRLRDANKRASAGATDSEARAETKWDTCSLEASYLARGHAQQFSQISSDVQSLQVAVLPDCRNRPIEMGALAEVDIGFGPKFFFLLHCGGGMKLSVEGDDVTVITPESPIGAALIGKKRGDSFSFREGAIGKILNVE